MMLSTCALLLLLLIFPAPVFLTPVQPADNISPIGPIRCANILNHCGKPLQGTLAPNALLAPNPTVVSLIVKDDFVSYVVSMRVGDETSSTNCEFSKSAPRIWFKAHFFPRHVIHRHRLSQYLCRRRPALCPNILKHEYYTACGASFSAPHSTPRNLCPFRMGPTASRVSKVNGVTFCRSFSRSCRAGFEFFDNITLGCFSWNQSTGVADVVEFSPSSEIVGC